MRRPPMSDPVAPARHNESAGLLPAVQSLLTIVIAAIFIITFCVQPFRIPSESMEPTLLVGDFLLVDKQVQGFDESAGVLPAASIQRGQIVVFHYPVNPSMHLIKRVVGLPGDHLRLREGHVFIDGRRLDEPYAFYSASQPDSFRDNFPRLDRPDPEIDARWWVRLHTLIDHEELVIPAGDYFVLGDNRNDSEDSRYWGFVPRSAIEGTPMVIYFSLEPRGEATVAEAPGTGAGLRLLDAVLEFARWSRTLQRVQ
ncbi:MAG: signal peptidase I [Acidobacteriota bacterium]|nr:signal peptidase I [Acidobacteriota bacterium]